MFQCDITLLQKLWKELGLSPGQTVLCHSFLPSLGRVSPGLNIVLDTLVEAIGPIGTLVAPTFTYSYFNGHVYDSSQSASTVGVLGDLVRKHPDALRSLDPNFSMAAIGPLAAELMRRDTIHSLGPQSVFDKLIAANAQILLIGVDFTALPLFMHLEKMHSVDYRYDKQFVGRTRHNGNVFEDVAVHYVRDEKRNPESLRSRAGDEIDAHYTCRKCYLGYAYHRLVPARTVVDIVDKGLARDKFFLLKHPA